MSVKTQLELVFGSGECLSDDDYVKIARVVHVMYTNPERNLQN